MAEAAILKMEKPKYRGIIIDHHQIWHDNAYRLSKELSH